MPNPTSNDLDDLLRALRRHRDRLRRKRDAVRGDLAAAERAGEHRRAAEALLAYLHEVPRRASRVALRDPADASSTLEIELDPEVTAQVNAARYFKLAAKGARGLAEIPKRLDAVEREVARAEAMIARLEPLARATTTDPPPVDAGDASAVAREAFALLPPPLQRTLRPPAAAPESSGATARSAASGSPAPARPGSRERGVPARLTPRRLRTTEGWDVLIGRTNEGNDHLTHRLARPEDYWFHVHGAAGSHVVLRRGKGKNEPSRQTLEEVAAWAAFYSQARTAGKVPVIYTRKKYVRKPRNAPAGLAVCEREKSLMVRPVEPPRSALADAAEPAGD